jgi:hypothetical protein
VSKWIILVFFVSVVISYVFWLPYVCLYVCAVSFIGHLAVHTVR